jgi:hypothetical protein
LAASDSRRVKHTSAGKPPMLRRSFATLKAVCADWECTYLFS